jgi:hypothetical protein
MYRALYEAIPIALVVEMRALREMYGDPPDDGSRPTPRAPDVRTLFDQLDPNAVANLESAVAYSALHERAEELFPTRFDPNALVTTGDIYGTVAPVWRESPPGRVCAELLAEVRRRWRIFVIDLTTAEAADLGLRVARVLSPELMALPLPSFPEAAHPRFDAYGGFASAAPHPYP